jgi:Ser/Thr protein kinase RdoA (MazF antagonist)
MKSDLAQAFDLGPEFSATLINVSENHTYRIDTSRGAKFALRLARPDYHTPEEFIAEMSWLEALQKDTPVKVAKPLRGRDGKYRQQVKGQNAFLFEWIEGAEPKISDDLAGLAEQLGAIAARLHEHVQRWPRPQGFTRPQWDFDAALGKQQRWGDWRKGLGVEPAMLPTLAETVEALRLKLVAYGTEASRFNLIHGDLRLANVLQAGAQIAVIDFDDCGFGWLMYDAATLISFHEHEPQAQAMIGKWIAGYRKIRKLSHEDEVAIQTLIMLRRILLLAWLGSHGEIELAQTLRPSFASQTLALCKNYLKSGSVF